MVELSEVQGVVEDPNIVLVEDAYTEAQARLQFARIRELIGAAQPQADLVRGLQAGLSLHDSIARNVDDDPTKSSPQSVPAYNLTAPGTVLTLQPPKQDVTPTTVKSLSLSHWNPPPYHLRARGHLLYILVTTLEGEQYHITSHVGGVYVNQSTTHTFDPSPRLAKPLAAHSLLTLLTQLSPAFNTGLTGLQTHQNQRDPLSAYTVSNTIPSSPWLVSSSAVTLASHKPDIVRTQESFLLAGSENSETLRDWNEEFQATRELPKDNVQDRVFRERLTSKLFAEYNETAVRGAVLVARGEVAPLNPTESIDAHIFVYNNVFYSFGADGVGTFASDGGDEAARVATGKDAIGVAAVNQLDITGLYTPGTVIVDYLGKRIVGQSIVPGIFKQREPGEHQIDYGGVEGKDIVAENEAFKQPFAELSKALHVKAHAVWDKENARHDLEASIETKGLLGTDGRKYILDLYRLTPLDIDWLEKHRQQDVSGDHTSESPVTYPHRMAVLRLELVESYWRMRLRAYVQSELDARKSATDTREVKNTATPDNNSTDVAELDNTKEDVMQDDRMDISNFKLMLNPDVCSGQRPQTQAEKDEWLADEAEVRAACTYLTAEVIPQLVREIKTGDTGFPVDGRSLTVLLHKRGVNMRYLGLLARTAGRENARLAALQQLAIREMVARAFKHIANRHLRRAAVVFAPSCIAHLLNCLFGTSDQPEPKAYTEPATRAFYPDSDYNFTNMTPAKLKQQIIDEVSLRYQYPLTTIVEPTTRMQTLREICLKLGLQLEAKDYFAPTAIETSQAAMPVTNGSSNGKKKKKAHDNQVHVAASRTRQKPFNPEDIYNIVPIVKEASPRSVLAEEALEAGRMSIAQDQRELGQELLLESLSLHEQIYGILHPEVARVYYALSTIYYGLNEKTAALELARKAVIISERTLGIDHAETVLAYLNLSLFEHAVGNTLKALAYVRHALDLWKIIYGPRHPDSITTINNGAVMLQSIKCYRESRQWFERSLDICNEMSGKTSINAATLLFQYAQSLALDRDSKAAVKRMREAYTIFRDELGAEDRNTKEAESWLDSLTQSAVSLAKFAKESAVRKTLLQSKSARQAIAPLPSQPNGISVGSSARGVDQRSVDELLQYINSSGSETKAKRTSTQATRRR